LCHTTQHGAVLIIFSLNLQTITITRMLSSGGEEGGKMNFNSHTNVQILRCMTHKLHSMVRQGILDIEKFGMADLIKCDLS